MGGAVGNVVDMDCVAAVVEGIVDRIGFGSLVSFCHLGSTLIG